MLYIIETNIYSITNRSLYLQWGVDKKNLLIFFAAGESNNTDLVFFVTIVRRLS